MSAIVAAGNAHVGAPPSEGENLTGTMPFDLKLLDPSALIGAWTLALYEET
jgi:hypothetical protein